MYVIINRGSVQNPSAHPAQNAFSLHEYDIRYRNIETCSGWYIQIDQSIDDFSNVFLLHKRNFFNLHEVNEVADYLKICFQTQTDLEFKNSDHLKALFYFGT